ncbi:MAG: TIM barrel protein [Candidatus Dojkabacteria bacterium]|nr:TIM barrel protein [Candidatus Dojkabacteria bacterium]
MNNRTPQSPRSPGTLHFGPGGIPLSTKVLKDPETGKLIEPRESAIYRLKELSLDHMEVEFVYGVNITEESARSLGERAQKNGVTLTVHGPYYINLASKEKPKYYASLHRVEQTLLAAHWLGAPSVTFHAGFYQGRTAQETTEMIRTALLQILENRRLTKELGENPDDWPLISLETTGKPSQWGSLEEILDLAREINAQTGAFRVAACIDFAHLHARSNGACNSIAEFSETLDHVSQKLGPEALSHQHMHLSGIRYTPKGERNHLTLKEADLKYRDLLQVLRKNNVTGWLVCESPNLEDDAQIMKKYYESL